jgi:hypothetical protein
MRPPVSNYQNLKSNKMKPFALALLSMSFTFSFFACNNSRSSQNEKQEDIVTKPTAAVQPEAFTPFDAMVITHTVKDYASWRPLFDADSTARNAAGLELLTVGKSTDNPNHVTIVFKMRSVQEAQKFAGDPRLKQVMEKGGVVSRPTIEYYNIARFNTEAPIKQWVTITHRVKDFDAWVKVFDKEGATQRAAEGMMDLALARGIDDANIVHIVLEITDMAKAKAALSSDAKKKLMESAGVMEQPRFEYYKASQ